MGVNVLGLGAPHQLADPLKKGFGPAVAESV